MKYCLRQMKNQPFFGGFPQNKAHFFCTATYIITTAKPDSTAFATFFQSFIECLSESLFEINRVHQKHIHSRSKWQVNVAECMKRGQTTPGQYVLARSRIN